MHHFFLYFVAALVLFGVGVYFATKIRRWLRARKLDAIAFGKSESSKLKSKLP